jgi:type II secretory pathway component PulF
VAIETASSVIEPIMLAFVGVMTGVAVISSAVPMLSILQGL